MASKSFTRATALFTLIVFSLIVATSAAVTDCNLRSSDAICGMKGEIFKKHRSWVLETYHDKEHLTPEACAIACANRDHCHSFYINMEQRGFCTLLSVATTEAKLRATRFAFYKGYDITCFTCFDAIASDSSPLSSSISPSATTTSSSISSSPLSSSTSTSVTTTSSSSSSSSLSSSTSVSATSATNCTRQAPPSDAICGMRGHIFKTHQGWELDDFLDSENIAPEACAAACANTANCQSFYTDTKGRGFCGLLSATTARVEFGVTIYGRYHGYDITCFTCIDASGSNPSSSLSSLPTPTLATITSSSSSSSSLSSSTSISATATTSCTQQTPPSDAVCGMKGSEMYKYLPDSILRYYRDTKYFNTPEACAAACADTASCQSFYTRQGGFCYLLTATIAKTGFYAGKFGSDLAYDITCFTCNNATASSSSSSLSLSTSTPAKIASPLSSSSSSLSSSTTGTSYFLKDLKL